ncbi:TPA: hypothetical protein KWY91_001859 [Escherichia coli]|nr:hypothetical protein [Escherichia coli]
MTRPAGSLDKRTISANTTVLGEVKSFLLAQFLKKWRRTKWGDIPGKYRYQMMLKSRNSVPGLKGMRISICVYL